MFKTVSIRTSSSVELKDITGLVRYFVRDSGVKDGILVLFVPHTTAGVTINENADPSVKRDMIMEMDKVIPLSDGYAHSEGNSAAHIKSSLFGPSLTLIVENGSIVLGTWQGILFCEFDGPRNRKLYLKIIEG